MQHFDTVELNTSFYHLPKKEYLQRWHETAAANNEKFIFAVKLYRLFTHFRKLKLKPEDQELLKIFFGHVDALKNSIGPICIQCPPSLKCDLTVLKQFIKDLKNALPKRKAKPLIAIEFRNKTWFKPDVYKILKKENISFVISDSPRWPTDIVKTADWLYVRFHGKPFLFASKYSDQALREWLKKLKALKTKKLYVYFNNDGNAHAVENALFLKKLAKNK